VILLSIALFSFLSEISIYFSKLIWAFLFLKGGYSVGLIQFGQFLQYVNYIFLIIFSISSILFMLTFYLFFRNKKTDIKYWIVKRNKITKIFSNALLISMIGILVLNSSVLIVVIPQIAQAGTKIDQFVDEKGEDNLPIFVTEIRQFFSDNNYNHSYGKNESVFEIDEVIFTNPIDKTLIEAFGVCRGELILYQHWGSCGQSALLTEEILLRCGYEARHAKFIDVDHEWAEVKYNGNWTIIDPWNSAGLFDIHNLCEYYPNYKDANGVEITYNNGTTVQAFEEYGYYN
jgi:hypothetical protein